MDFNNVICFMNGYDYVDLDDKNIIKLESSSSSKGNQSKYYDTINRRYIKEQFMYQGIKWKDYIVENLSYIIGKQLNTDIKIIKQDIVQLSNGNYGVRSDDFAIDKQRISIAKITNINNIYDKLDKPDLVFNQLLQVYTDIGIDINEAKNYLYVMIILDFILGNEDRHYNNMGIILDNGKYTISPLFDFGLGLFEHDSRYIGKTLFSAKALMSGKPFSRDLSNAFDMIINVGGIDTIRNICNRLSIIPRHLFPSDLAYEYYIDAYDYIKRELKL